MRQVLATAAVICCAAAAAAATKAAPPGVARAAAVFAAGGAGTSQLDASALLGKSVYAVGAGWTGGAVDRPKPGWRDIGQISDIVLGRDGHGPAVLVDIGGFLASGGKTVAVRLRALQFVPMKSDRNAFFVVLSADKATLAKAPAFRPGSLGDWASMGSGPSAAAGGAAAAAQAADNSETAATGNAADPYMPVVDSTASDAKTGTGTPAAVGGSGSASAAGVQGGTPGRVAAGGAMASNHGPAAPAVPKGYAAVDAAVLTGDRLGGVPVYGPGGRVIGSVSKVLEDGKGRPRFLVVDVGGFLGFGERPVKLALGAVSIQRQVAGGALRAVVGLTEAQMKARPVYKG